MIPEAKVTLFSSLGALGLIGDCFPRRRSHARPRLGGGWGLGQGFQITFHLDLHIRYHMDLLVRPGYPCLSTGQSIQKGRVGSGGGGDWVRGNADEPVPLV